MRTLLQNFKILVALCTAVFFSEMITAQFNIPPKPSDRDQHFVYDYVDLLSKEESRLLELKLKNYADTTSTQIVIAIIKSTKGEDISFLGAKWGQKWGIGQADEDNGILIILAKDDRTIDINTGYGIEYRITDRMAEQVINGYMIPEFRNGNYYQGLNKGTSVIFEMLAGEFKAEPKSDFPYAHIVLFAIFLLFWIIMISASRKGRGGKGGKRGGSGLDTLLDVIILSNAGRIGGSSWGGSSGGGGFGGGGFGGGGFGGGGASGSW